MGLMSDVGDLGANMSTGQQQRLLIARALYKNPRILIFDEATANLNNDIEIQILKNLKNLNKTIIFASHSSNVKGIADRTWDIPLLAVEPSR